MFKTALRETDNPERYSRTPGPSTRKRIRINLENSREKETLVGNYSTLRPQTSPLMNQKYYQTLNSTARESHLMNLSSIDAVENELELKYKEEMCGYLRRKLRGLVGKRQQDMAQSRCLHSTIESHSLDNHSTIGPLDHFYSIFHQKSRLKVEKGVDGAYVSNTKEQILRLIQRKRQQQVDFKEINRSIKVRRQSRDQKRSTSLREQFKVPAIQKQEWDQEWKQSLGKEKTRYRNRLISKFNRENSPLLVNFQD